ncbi:hypothetical protein BpHYR1_042332 [Brachionus plicatilis]|uniref:Uncharacterized protein n=1 Tax=Brachionus plicatilis TaxID=10195 RepID=A0A3M7SV00_BRAPC|nr:hypothetical protein BpHYR1_042332 [Brachionus plicatilis]
MVIFEWNSYTSIHLDDCPSYGAFTYRMRGFKNHTAKHYPKHYQLALSRQKKTNDDCNGDTKLHKILLDLFLDFKRLHHRKQPNIAVMHYVKNSHGTNNHGLRFNQKRSSQRYVEERLPFFSVYLPENFINNNKFKFENFKENLNKLTSPFDIYDTVRDLTCLPRSKSHYRHRSISLFDKISKFRSCEDIGIGDHFCTCIKNWQPQNSTSDESIIVTNFAIQTLNQITNNTRDLCQILSLKRMISADKLIQTKGNIYRVSFITSPNSGVYETIIYQDMFSIKSRNDISRIDSYGEQPWCVAKFGSNPGRYVEKARDINKKKDIKTRSHSMIIIFKRRLLDECWKKAERCLITEKSAKKMD